MEEFRLFDQNLVEIPLNKGFPKQYQKKYSFQGTTKYHGFHGKLPMLFQAIKIGPYEAVLSDYLTTVNTKLTCIAHADCIEAHFLLTGSVQFRLEGFGWTGMHQGRFNLIALSKVKNQVLFKIPPLTTFDIHIPKSKLIALARRFDQLKKLLKALKEGRFASLYEQPQIITVAMLQLIYKIRRAVTTGQANRPEIIQMVEELIIHIFDKSTTRTKYKYSFEEVIQINEAHRLIAEYLDEKDILSRKIAETKIKPDKFREGFKIIFGVLPSEYLTNCRLHLAKEIAEAGTVHKVSDIIQMCGYGSTKTLSRAFYNYYGTKIAGVLKKTKGKN